jgi:hypothetical protein
MGYKYKQKDVEKVRRLFFRTELRPDEETIDNLSTTIVEETGFKLSYVETIISKILVEKYNDTFRERKRAEMKEFNLKLRQ